ncbi:hypothetical protein NXH76_23900 [Blautia schinkii]|nr:hypothetical protein [Blautia schinkii]
MGVKDQEFAEYAGDLIRYADLMNGTVFHGRQVVQAEYLKKALRKKRVYLGIQTEEKIQKNGSDQDVSKETGQKAQYVERERDVLMLYDKPQAKFYLASEAQAEADYAMSVRCFTYDAVEYSDQLKNGEQREKCEDGIIRPLIPVFHQVLYLGEKRWLSKHDLKEMMLIPEEVQEFAHLLPNYQIHVIDIHEQDPELFRTEWKDIFRLMAHSRRKEELKKYVEENKEYILALSADTRRFLAVLLEQYEITEDGKVEVKDVCEAWDGAMMMYRDEGLQEGLREGGIQALIWDNVEEGRQKTVIIEKLQRRFSLPAEEAEKYYERCTAEPVQQVW